MTFQRYATNFKYNRVPINNKTKTVLHHKDLDIVFDGDEERVKRMLNKNRKSK